MSNADSGSDPVEKAVSRLADIPREEKPGVLYILWKATPLKGVQKLLVSKRKLNGDIVLDCGACRVPSRCYPDEATATSWSKVLADRYASKQQLDKPAREEKLLRRWALTEREKQLFQWKEEGLSLQAIAERWNVSKEIVRQRQSKANNKIERMTGADLRVF